MKEGNRFGFVTKTDVKNGLYRVNIPADEIVTPWIPRLEPNTKDTGNSTPLKEGEHVLVWLDEHAETGVILGAIYDTSNLPPGLIANDNLHAVQFEDGTKITYDKGAGIYTVDSVGKVIIKAAAEVEIHCTTLKVSGAIEATGDITSTAGDVKALTVSLLTHVHVETGTTTAPPTP
jgi:phage baseplate assembly protein V